MTGRVLLLMCCICAAGPAVAQTVVFQSTTRTFSREFPHAKGFKLVVPVESHVGRGVARLWTREGSCTSSTRPDLQALSGALERHPVYGRTLAFQVQRLKYSARYCFGVELFQAVPASWRREIRAAVLDAPLRLEATMGGATESLLAHHLGRRLPALKRFYTFKEQRRQLPLPAAVAGRVAPLPAFKALASSAGQLVGALRRLNQATGQTRSLALLVAQRSPLVATQLHHLASSLAALPGAAQLKRPPADSLIAAIRAHRASMTRASGALCAKGEATCQLGQAVSAEMSAVDKELVLLRRSSKAQGEQRARLAAAL